jgi:glycerophosphoryl diester phosphodiesterase
MLLIGHRGAAGLAPENTLESLRAGVAAGVDILEFDVRVTADNIPILHHDFHTLRTNHSAKLIHRSTLAELQSIAKKHPIATLESVLDEFYGTIMLNIEIKHADAITPVIDLLKKLFTKRKADWDNILFSSFKGKILSDIRSQAKYANLSLLHDQNPFLFIAYHRRLHLSAVGFHRLYINQFALEIAKQTGLFRYVYTVDRPHTAILLDQRGIDGVVTNHPDILLAQLEKSKA